MRTPQPVPTARALVGAVLAAVGALLVWRGVASALPYRLVADSGASVGASTAAAADDALWIVRTLPSLRDPAYIWLRLCYFYASSYQFRWRFYACWLVMDVSGQLLGLAHPSNVEIAACELATSPSMLITGWNTSVQLWLKERIYRQLPRATPRGVRMLATFAVSAFWHGVHPGYYLMFAGLFVMVCVEQLVRAAWMRAPMLDADRSPATAAAARFVGHVWTMSCFSFFGGAFNLLGWRETLNLWRSLWFYGLWLAALPALPAALWLVMSQKGKQKDSRPTKKEQ